MEIRCPSCQARYELELELVQRGPVRVQCTRCESIFRVESRSVRGDVWKIRKRDGRTIELDGLHTLQRWIVERRVERSDEISRTGEQWKTLGSITELSSFFAIIDELDRATSDDLALPDVDDGLDALDAIQFETPTQDDDDAAAAADPDELTSALLASLSVEKSQVRRPISAAVRAADPDTLRALRDSIDDAPEVDIELELPTVSPTILAHPRPTRAPVLPHAAADDSGVRPAVALPEIGGTGIGWFSSESAAAAAEPASIVPPPPVVADTPQPLVLDEDLEPATRKRNNHAPLFIAAAAVLVLGATIIALVSGGGEATTTNQAEATPSAETPQSAAASGTAALPPDEPSTSPTEAAAAVPEPAAEALPDSATPPVETQSPAEATDTALAGRSLPASDPPAPEPPPEKPATEKPATEKPREDKTTRKTSDEEAASVSGYAGHFKRAERAREKGDHEAAITHYEEAIAIKRTAEAYSGMGWTYVARGDAHRATSFFERAVELSSSHGDALIGLGNAYQKLGKKKKALEAYEAYLERLPSGPERSIAENQARRLREELAPKTPPKPPEEKKTDPAPSQDASSTTTTTTTTTTTGAGDDKKIIIIKKAP